MEAKVKTKTKTEKETADGETTIFSVMFEGEDGTFTLRTEDEILFDSFPLKSDVKISINPFQQKLDK